MLDNSVYQSSGKASLKRARRWLLLLMLVLAMGIVSLIFYTSSQQPLWPLGLWDPHSELEPRSGLDQPLYNMTTSDGSYFVEYPQHYNFIKDEPDRCRHQSPFLVLMIPVEPHNREARDIIRNTWGKETAVLDKVVTHYFLLGLPEGRNGSEPIEEGVLEESQKHHDILQSDFLDSYNNLTIKTMVMMEWLSTHCPNTPYAMKVDSDIFLNVHNLVAMLLNAPRELYMTGHLVRGASVLRDPTSKWFLPVSVFPDATYPPYIMGLGYVFSLDLTRKIVEASPHVKAIYIEDVYVGLCMRHLGIEVTDPPRDNLFHSSVPYFTNGCQWRSVVATILTNSKQLLEVWGTFESQQQSEC